MKIILSIIFIILAVQCHGQNASFKEIKRKPNSRYFNTKEATIIFPLVVTKYPGINKLINAQIKKDMFHPDDEMQSLNKIIEENINKYGLINLSYKVTCNSAGFLSFSISAEGCGSYCSSWATYFNFDLLTGKKITINDIFLIDKIDSFKNIVRLDKINALTKYKEEEEGYFINQDIDSSIYNWAISQVDENCMNEVSVENFSISSNAIEISDPCEFPHAIRSQQPVIELKYPGNSISKFLKPKYRKLLK
ncbi:MAG: hypothetical protein ABIO04_07600 [Ferruginibacter sp.]